MYFSYSSWIQAVQRYRDKFEYYIWKVNVTLENKIIKRELDKVGHYGWELVNSIPEGHNSNNYIFVFKRKK